MMSEGKFIHMESWEEEDLISKLLRKSNVSERVSTEKSLRQEFMEAGELVDAILDSAPVRKARPKRSSLKRETLLDEISPDQSSKVEKSFEARSFKKLISCVEKGKSGLNQFSVSKYLEEFRILSKIMDSEIAQSHETISDERSCRKALETKNEKCENRLEELTKRMERVREEYQKLLEQKDNTIEEMKLQNKELENDVSSASDDVHALSLENEELSECLELQTSEVEKLRVQMSACEYERDQTAWKLSQADDLVEMVEKQRGDEMLKYRTVVRKLKAKLDTPITTQAASPKETPRAYKIMDRQARKDFINKQISREKRLLFAQCLKF